MSQANPAYTTAATLGLAVPNRVLREHASALRRHLQQCGAAQSRWAGAAALAERLHGLLAPRFISTLLVAMLVLGIATEWV